MQFSKKTKGVLTGLLLAALAAGSAGTALPSYQLYQQTDSDNIVRFAAIGDQGTGKKGQFQIAEQMVRWHGLLPYNIVITLGDNIYGGPFGWGGGHRKDFPKKFDKPYAELLRRGVWFRASLGNHDTKKDSGRHLIEDKERFHIDGEHGYYNFTAGRTATGARLVEFFALNTVRFDRGREDPGQLKWLEQALQNSRARWKIVYGHHSMYSTGKRHGADKRLREMVEPLLVASSVPVVLGGHDHIYQRFHPQQGVVYFVCGSSGKLRRGNAKPDPSVAVTEDRRNVFMLWEVLATELRFRAITSSGEAFDCGMVGREGVVTRTDCGNWPGLTNP